MDTSEKYIKMCEKAQEIQNLHSKIISWMDGDFIVKNEVDIYTSNSFNGGDYDCEDFIWLPR